MRDAMIELIDVTYAYPAADGAVTALDGVSTTLAAGELVVVLGANGSGKSTLVKLADGLLRPRSGSVVVDGMDTSDPEHTWAVRSRVGLVFQNPDNQIVATTVEEDVAFGPENLGIEREEIRRRVDRAISAVGLEGLERREPHQLSGGQRQRLAIAGALALDPAYLALDEPTSMLDLQGRADVLAVLAALRERGTGILHATHQLADAASADRVLVLSDGKVAFEGPPAELLGSDDTLRGLGLTSPPIGRLAAELRTLGVSVPVEALTAERVVAAL